VLLDALGTLLALEPPAPRLRVALRERLGLDVGDEAAAGAIRAEIAYYRAHLDEAADLAGLADLRRRCAEVVRERLALPAAAHAAVLAALLAAIRFTPYADVVPALRALRARGRRLVVVSNWDVSLHEALRATGLAPLMDGGVASAQLGVAKPAPAIFAHALELAGVPAAAAVHVGDSLEADFAGARAAGLPGVLVHRDGGAPPAGVPSVRELGELVAVAPYP